MILEDLDVDDDIDSIEELFYKFSPVLMQQLPERTVEMWKRNTPWLRQPCKLIPALVKHDQHRQRMKSQGKGSRGNDFAINYLKFAVKECNNEDLAIHNFLLALVRDDCSHRCCCRELIFRGPDRPDFFSVVVVGTERE